MAWAGLGLCNVRRTYEVQGLVCDEYVGAWIVIYDGCIDGVAKRNGLISFVLLPYAGICFQEIESIERERGRTSSSYHNDKALASF